MPNNASNFVVKHYFYLFTIYFVLFLAKFNVRLFYYFEIPTIDPLYVLHFKLACVFKLGFVIQKIYYELSSESLLEVLFTD